MYCHRCGRTLVGDRPAYCSGCGEPVSATSSGADTAQPPAPRPSDTTGPIPRIPTTSRTTCPRCGTHDNVQRVSTVVAGGYSTTSGAAITGPIIGNGPLQATLFGANNATDLAVRLEGPGEPGFAWIKAFLVWLLVGFLGVALYAKATSPGQDWVYAIIATALVGAFIAIPFAILATLLERLVRQPLISRQQAWWFARHGRLMDAYYCFRDDVIFDDRECARPDTYIDRVFYGD